MKKEKLGPVLAMVVLGTLGSFIVVGFCLLSGTADDLKTIIIGKLIGIGFILIPGFIIYKLVQ